LNTKLKFIFHNPWTELVVRWFLGATFIYAGCQKIADPSYFAKIVYGYGLLPGALINLVAIIMPYLECYAGLFLIVGIYPRSAAIIINGLLFTFIIALSINVIRGHQFDCGCFSFGKPAEYTNPRLLIGRDMVYFFCGLYIFFYSRARKWCIGS